VQTGEAAIRAAIARHAIRPCVPGHPVRTCVRGNTIRSGFRVATVGGRWEDAQPECLATTAGQGDENQPEPGNPQDRCRLSHAAMVPSSQ
jgi:hypothetical protein